MKIQYWVIDMHEYAGEVDSNSIKNKFDNEVDAINFIYTNTSNGEKLTIVKVYFRG